MAKPNQGSAWRDPDDGLRGLVVAIDGPSGSGKSTVAREVARRLRLRYLDTGAMYRAVTWRALQERIDLEDAEKLGTLAERTMLRISTDPDDFWVSADGDDVTAEIRTRAVTNAVSAVSAVPAVRARLIDEQRKIIDAGGIVVEGRDIGTVVAPDAQAKFFLTASSAERAVRRAKQLDGPQVPESAVRLTRAEIDRRDRLDSSFTPTPRAADAMVLDSTALTADEVVEQVLRLAKVR